MILLNPGPVTLSAGVRAALTGPDLCHREPEFAALQDRIRTQLLSVYGLDPDIWTAVLLTGSGTAAMEAMVSSLVPDNAPLLVVENGVYGTRLATIARVHGIAATSVEAPWGQWVDPARVAEALDAHPDIRHLAVVHHETTTGRRNDLDALAAVCAPRGVALLVDGVSSFGGEAMLFDGPVTAVAATANKCLHGVPGISFVIACRDALDAGAQRTLYLDLPTYAAEQDRGGTPFTQSIQVLYALDTALAELAAGGGWSARHATYRERATRVREGLARLGIEGLLSAADSSVVLAAYQLPSGVDYARLHDTVKAAGFIIYAGQGDFAKTLFRVATMGQMTVADLDRFVAAIAPLTGTTTV